MKDALFGEIPSYFSVDYYKSIWPQHVKDSGSSGVPAYLQSGGERTACPSLLLERSGRAPRPAKGEKGSLGFFYLEASCGVMDRCFNMGRYGRE